MKRVLFNILLLICYESYSSCMHIKKLNTIMDTFINHQDNRECVDISKNFDKYNKKVHIKTLPQSLLYTF